MKKYFEAPKLRLVTILAGDVIVTSGDGTGEGDGEIPDDDSEP